MEDISSRVAPDKAIMTAFNGAPGKREQMTIHPVPRPQGTGWLCAKDNPLEIYPDTERFRIHGDKLRECVLSPEQLEQVRGRGGKTLMYPNGTYVDQYDAAPSNVMPPIITAPLMPQPPVVPPNVTQ